MRKQMCEESVERECAVFTCDQLHIAGRNHELVVSGDGEIAYVSRADELHSIVNNAHIKYDDDIGAMSRCVFLIKFHAMLSELLEANVRSEPKNYSKSASGRERAGGCVLIHLADRTLFEPLDLFDLCEGFFKLALVEHSLDFDNRSDGVGRDYLVCAFILVHGTGLFVVDDDVLMIAHLVVHIDHEPLRCMEALRHVTVQKLPYFLFGLASLLPGMRDCLADMLEIITKLFGRLGN